MWTNGVRDGVEQGERHANPFVQRSAVNQRHRTCEGLSVNRRGDECSDPGLHARARTIPLGGVADLRNVHGLYAAVQVLDVKDDTRADDRDELRFRYAIQFDGSEDFSIRGEPEAHE